MPCWPAEYHHEYKCHSGLGLWLEDSVATIIRGSLPARQREGVLLRLQLGLLVEQIWAKVR